MKKAFGLCTILALITGVVFSDEVKSIVEQNADSEAAQAVESAVDSVTQPVQEALPEQEAQPELSIAPDPSIVEEDSPEIVQTPQPQDDSQTPKLSVNTPYIWGIITSPIPPMVRAQVTLPEEAGLFVQTIKPNGPAAKAGVLPYDIILSVDGAAISSTSDLAAAIQKAAGKTQKLTVLRQGKEITVNITAQRADASRQPHSLMFGTPQPFIDPLAPNYDPDEDDDNLDPSFPRMQHFMDFQRRQMEIMRQRIEAMENAMRQGMPGFMPFAPGAVPMPFPGPATAPVPNGALTLPPAPAPANDPNVQTQTDSFSVQVQKNGNDPAIIKIQENGNEYIVDENSLDQLPENVRKRLNFKIQSNDK